MKITILYRDIQNGGVQRNMLRLASLLAQDGHDVHFVVAESGENEFAVPEGVSLYRANTRHPVRLIRYLRAYFDRFAPDIVYTGMPNYNGIAVLSRFFSRIRPKLIISERSHTLVELQNTRFGIYKLSIYLSPLLYRFADRILAVSSDTADSVAAFTRIARDRITVMHNPVVSEKLRALAKAPLRHPWLDPPAELIVAVGRLARQKDYPTLLSAFALLHRQRPSVRLVVIGEGPDREQLETQANRLGIADAVQFAGFDANPYRWMSRCRAFVLTSLWEGLPTVIIEALACGATIVATDSPSGPRQIIGADTRLGYLAPMQDPQAIANALAQALDHPIRRELLLAEAEKYSEERAIETFNGIVESLLRPGALALEKS